jgi:hypothetical protein
MKRDGPARRAPGPASRRRGAGGKVRAGLGAADQPSEAGLLAQLGWVDWGGELIWAVGFTAGGAPFGLRAEEFDPADLQEIGVASGATWSWDDDELHADGRLTGDDVE